MNHRRVRIEVVVYETDDPNDVWPYLHGKSRGESSLVVPLRLPVDLGNIVESAIHAANAALDETISQKELEDEGDE